MRPFKLTKLLMSLAVLATCCCGGVAMAADGEAEPGAIAEAPQLEWGFKQSWRIYAPAPDVSGGASVVADPGEAPYQLAWAFESGSYDAGTGTTVLRYEGTAHWLKYHASQNVLPPPPGYSGSMDIHVLDVTMSDPVITIGPDESSISVLASSRQLDTWEMADLGRVPVVGLDVTGLAPTVAGGVTTWSGIPAATAGSSAEVFAGNYEVGRAVDEVGLSYTGPGGPPDLSEEWDPAGSAKLGLAENLILEEKAFDTQYDPFWLDRERRIVHTKRWSEEDEGWLYQAVSLDAMAPVGEPLVLADSEDFWGLTFFDTNTGRLFYTLAGEELPRHWIRYDEAQGEYVRETLDEPVPIRGNPNGLMWDSVGERAFNVELAELGETGEELQWRLHTYTEQEDGSWVAQSYDMPNFPDALNYTGYAQNSYDINATKGLAAPDGSLILLGESQESSDPEVEAPAIVPAAWRLVTDEDAGTVDVDPVAGTTVPNEWLRMYEAMQAGSDGKIVLVRTGIGAFRGPIVQSVYTPDDGGAPAATAPVEVPGLDNTWPTDFAVDPEDGTVWIGGWQSQRIAGVSEEGQVIANQYFKERHPRGGPLLAGPNHTVYAQTNDGSPATFGGSPIYGFGRFELLGHSPEVTLQPQSHTVELTSGEESEEVVFASTATADPEPQRQWQVKGAGASRFADLEGETGETLTVEASREGGDAQYRAVYANAAGRIASDPATLAVHHAPGLGVELADASAEEGEDVVFLAMTHGNPEPAVTWQRRVGGFWQSIAPGDDNFLLSGASLTVLDTNVDQSGALFRVKLENSVATTFSGAARLTVTSTSTAAPDGVGLGGTGSKPGAPPQLPAAGTGSSASAEGAQISRVRQARVPGGKRLAVVATLTCPEDGFCAVIVPRRVRLEMAGKRHWARVLAPRTIDAGASAALKVRLSRRALRRLGKGPATGRLALTVRSQGETVRRVIAVRVGRGRPKAGKRKAGPVGVGGPLSAPISVPPASLARPASAVDVSAVELTWHPRDSWIRYASSGTAAGDGILLSGGAMGTSATASPCPDRPSSSDAQLPYSIAFAPKASWYDPVSGTAGIYGQGSVSFRWAAHQIDLTASDPEIEIAGASSRAIFRFSGSGGTAYAEQRAPLVGLDVSGRPTAGNGGKTFSYDLMRGTLTADGVNVFAGFYTPPDNDEFGCVSVEFTVP